MQKKTTLLLSKEATKRTWFVIKNVCLLISTIACKEAFTPIRIINGDTFSKAFISYDRCRGNLRVMKWGDLGKDLRKKEMDSPSEPNYCY